MNQYRRVGEVKRTHQQDSRCEGGLRCTHPTNCSPSNFCKSTCKRAIYVRIGQ